MPDNKWDKMDSEEGVLFQQLVELLPHNVYSDLLTYIDEYAQEVYWEGFDEGYNDGLNGE
jgi:hypothetical protein